MDARFALAELLHDQAEDLEASTILGELERLMQANAEQGRQGDNGRYPVELVKARRHVFRSIDHRRKGEMEQARAELKEAWKVDPTEIDLLIELYRVPGLEDSFRTEVKRKIAEVAGRYRDQMVQDPTIPLAFNQFAWIVANTEGDYAEAVRASQKSLELSPGNPGYLDTLGRCYYAVGDFDNAVKHQSEAVRQQPGSGSMRRQLQLFEEARAAKQRTANPDAAPATSAEPGVEVR
jgi:tetratricopeptide (TPR) repeat protein